MKLRNTVRQATEFWIALIAIATVLVAGCGGGGGSTGGPTTLACPATGDVSGAAAVNCILAESASGSWLATSLGASGIPASAYFNSFSSVGGNSYTLTASNYYQLPGSSVWSTSTQSLVTSYYLTATGWQIIPAEHIFVNNGNGTMTSNHAGYQIDSTAFTRTDLSGQAVACTSPMGGYYVGQNMGSNVAAASCPVPGSYPAGSASYAVNSTNSLAADAYFMYEGSITDGAGVVLTALPAVGTRFCATGWVYDPIVGAAAGADNYNLYTVSNPSANTPSCSAAFIATALSSPTPRFTAWVGLKATGNAVVPNVLEAKWTSNTKQITDEIYVFHLNKFMAGYFSAAGTSYSATQYTLNKTAVNAQLRANGIASLP